MGCSSSPPSACSYAFPFENTAGWEATALACCLACHYHRTTCHCALLCGWWAFPLSCLLYPSTYFPSFSTIFISLLPLTSPSLISMHGFFCSCMSIFFNTFWFWACLPGRFWTGRLVSKLSFVGQVDSGTMVCWFGLGHSLPTWRATHNLIYLPLTIKHATGMVAAAAHVPVLPIHALLHMNSWFLPFSVLYYLHSPFSVFAGCIPFSHAIRSFPTTRFQFPIPPVSLPPPPGACVWPVWLCPTPAPCPMTIPPCWLPFREGPYCTIPSLHGTYGRDLHMPCFVNMNLPLPLILPY